MDELEWTPDVKAAKIGVSVNDGIVTLSGEVESITEQIAAKKAALRIRGVSAVANDLRVDSAGSAKTDTEIAKAVRDALSWDAAVPPNTIKAEVRDGVVILLGIVDWNYQREAARRVVERLAGVRRVDSRIELTRRPSADIAEEAIRRALVRNVQLDAKSITVTTHGDEVTLSGTVSSWAEKKQAEHAAWSSAHVRTVHNNIVVRPL